MTRRRLVGWLGLAALAGVLLLAVSFVLRPFWYFERLGKAALRAAGLERAELALPRGRLAYWKGGVGPTVVLVHGANDQAGAWSLIAKPLAASHRLVIPDLPGHGESGPAEGALTTADLFDGVERLVEAEWQGRPVLLVGNSLGGWLALLSAWKHPERAAGVVLVNGAAVSAAPGADISLLPANREQAARAMEALTDPASPRVPGFVLDDVVRRAPTSPLARLLKAPVDPALVLDGRLGEVRTPVTLLWGESDAYLTKAYAQAVAAELKDARLELLPDCGHLPQRECPDRLLPALERALAAPGDRGR